MKIAKGKGPFHTASVGHIVVSNRDGIEILLDVEENIQQLILQVSVEELKELLTKINSSFERETTTLDGKTDRIWAFNKLFPTFSSFFDYLRQ